MIDSDEAGLATQAFVEFLQALDELEEMLYETARRTATMQLRARRFRKAFEEGRDLREVIATESAPRIVTLLSENLEAIKEFGGQFRRAEARALYRDGMSQEEIARLFGVTRQRVSMLCAGMNDSNGHASDSP